MNPSSGEIDHLLMSLRIGLTRRLAEDRELQALDAGGPAEEIAVENVEREKAKKGDETAEIPMEVDPPEERPGLCFKSLLHHRSHGWRQPH